MNSVRMLSNAWWGGIAPMLAQIELRDGERSNTQTLLFLAAFVFAPKHGLLASRRVAKLESAT